MLNFYGSTLTEDGIGLAASLNYQAIVTQLGCHNISLKVLSRPVSHQKMSADIGSFYSQITPTSLQGSEFDFNYFHFSPRWCMQYLDKKSIKHYRDFTNIGYWVCEVPSIPSEWLDFVMVYKEIWTASEFCRDIYKRFVDIPVYTIPHPILYRNKSQRVLDRAKHQTNEPFTFLIIANAFSDLKRKNVIATVKAYKTVFPFSEPSKFRLVIKLTNVEADPYEYGLILHEIACRDDIICIDQHYSQGLIQKLYDNCDCYISLHRGEGFGLTISDALARGIPTISTNYSGSLEFTQFEGSPLVDACLVNVGEDRLRYRREDVWADPLIDHASDVINSVVLNYQYYVSMAMRQRRIILNRFSLESIGKIMNERLEYYKQF